MFNPPSLASTEWRSGGLPGTGAAVTYRVLLFLAAGFVVVAAEGGLGEPAMSFVCSCENTSKRALERARSGAADVLRLLLR